MRSATSMSKGRWRDGCQIEGCGSFGLIDGGGYVPVCMFSPEKVAMAAASAEKEENVVQAEMKTRIGNS